MNDTFSIRWLHLFGGRLAASYVVNTAISRPLGVRIERLEDAGWYVTIRLPRHRFINVDWT